MLMELERIISDFLMTAIIILSAGIILYPLTFSTILDVDEWLARRGVRDRRDLWRKLTQRERRVDAAVQSGAVVARLPAPDMPERRRHIRLKTGILGTLHPDTASLAANICDILDISASGARIRPVDPMAEAPLVALGIDRFGLFPAQVVWRNRDEVGLRFLQSPATVAHGMRGLVPTDCREAAPIARAA
jgi:hypothetical protein